MLDFNLSRNQTEEVNMQITYFGKAVQYIYDHIDEPLLLEDIAAHIDLSVSSLKRLFENITQQTPGKFIRRLKLELAFRSLQSKNTSILEVALSTGFDHHAAFSRCFKNAFGYTPSEARKQISILNELEHIDLGEPDIVELIGFSCQSVTKMGTYFEAAPQAFSVLKQALQSDELGDNFSGFFIGIRHDNPHDEGIAVDKVRFSAGVAGATKHLALEEICLPSGYYARFRYYGKPSNMGLAYHYIYGKWARASQSVVDNERVTFQAFERFPDGMQEEKIWINVPLANLPSLAK